jgi:hypothetical protein
MVMKLMIMHDAARKAQPHKPTCRRRLASLPNRDGGVHTQLNHSLVGVSPHSLTIPEEIEDEL